MQRDIKMQMRRLLEVFGSEEPLEKEDRFLPALGPEIGCLFEFKHGDTGCGREPL